MNGRHNAGYGSRAWVHGHWTRWVERHRDGLGPISWRGWFLLGYLAVIVGAVVWVVRAV